MIGLEKEKADGFFPETPRRSPNLAFDGNRLFYATLSPVTSRTPPGAVIVIRHTTPNLYFKEPFRGGPRTFLKPAGQSSRYHL
jgi:hypothetical protein